MLRKYLFALLFLLSLVLVTCTIQTPEIKSKVPTNEHPLTIWWNQGYFAGENQSIKKIVSDWQQKSGIPVKIEIISEDDIDKQTIAALKEGKPPDILFSMRTDSALSSRWTWEGKLADVSDLLLPLKDLYSPIALESVYMYNKKTKKFGYYAVPFQQNSVHLHYWRNLIDDAGFVDSDIPQEWDAFWDFWKQAQDALRAKGQNIYGLAISLSPEATNDTFYAFEQFLEAYDIRLLDRKGKLQLDDPEVRQGLISTLEWVTSFYKDGYIAPEAVKWRGSDNNIEFLNRNAIMVDNTTMSIPASQRKDEETYLDRMVTVEFPKEPDGEKITSLVAVKQLLVFAESEHQQAAKDFLSYLVQPETLKPYFKSAAGRWYPVMPVLWEDPFWNDPADPHVFVAAKQFRNNSTRLLDRVLNPAYSEVHAENVWGQTMKRIVVDGISPEAAADEAIEKIKDIFARWGAIAPKKRSQSYN